RSTRTANREPKRSVLAQHKARGHRRQWSLASCHRIVLALDQSVGVWSSRLGGKVVHFVVEKYSRAFRCDSRAVATVQRVGVGHGISIFIDNREMRGLFRFVTGRLSS